MKKSLSILLTTAILLMFSASAFAANGDVAGYIYSTDIRAFINDVEVESYNIGGKTAVVIEDIIKQNSNEYIYDDSTRTLKVFSLNPYSLVENKSQNNSKPGAVVGNVYKTDIKTLFYDVVVPTYNIGGKTAVAIEDLGYDNAFSPIGGKYIWNDKERTISLEFLYDKWSEISRDKDITVSFNETMTEATATFEEKFHCGGGKEHFVFPDYVTDDADIEVVVPIKAEGETIGYYFRRPSDTYKFTAFTYYYPEKVKIAEKSYIPEPKKTREEIISHFITRHSSGYKERFDTEDYSFVYISVAGTSWTAYNLLQVYDDGTYVDYKDEINIQNRSPKELVIDEKNEKVTFKHVDRYTPEWFTNYEIDLKSGTIKEINNLETDIGIGTADGQPPESEQTQSRTGQYEYKLISDKEETIVKGFFAHEYYYADMLPLAETFDFLNIKYSFENDILNIDTSEARSFEYVKTKNKAEILGEKPIEYLHVEKVLLNGAETQITYSYSSGHFDNSHDGIAEAKPYVSNGKVYINASFISRLLSENVTK